MSSSERRDFKVSGPEQAVVGLDSLFASEHHAPDVGLVTGPSGILGRVLEQIQVAAMDVCPVLVYGETGSGKELVARAIHARSKRARGPFVAVNCGALPSELIESELFGHARGAYTGAHQETKGLFRAADGGTLFLDEINSMPLPVQAKLLRVIQDKTVRPVGAAEEVPVDARIVSACNRLVSDALRDGSLRRDLFYRLSVLDIYLPPLRERLQDVPALFAFLATKHAARRGVRVAGVESEALDLLLAHDWPGNVRELENIVQRILAAREGTVVVGAADVRRHLRVAEAGAAPSVRPIARVVREAVAAEIRRALDVTGGDKTKAARLLGLPRRTFTRYLTKYLR